MTLRLVLSECASCECKELPVLRQKVRRLVDCLLIISIYAPERQLEARSKPQWLACRTLARPGYKELVGAKIEIVSPDHEGHRSWRNMVNSR